MTAGRFGAVVLGGDALRKALEAAPERVGKALGAALYEAGSGIVTDAKKRTPVDTGTLRASGYVTEPQDGPRGSVVQLGFGGAAKEYAGIVHERAFRSTSDGGMVPVRHEVGEAKFLENALNEWRPKLAPFLARAVPRALARGGAMEAGLHPARPPDALATGRRRKTKKSGGKRKRR